MPGNRNYKNGREKEYRVRKRLLAEGWDIVVRSAGSHSPFDLIAIKAPSLEMQGQIMLVQCKVGEHSVYEKTKAFREIERFRGDYNINVSVV